MFTLKGPDLAPLDWTAADSRRQQQRFGDGFAGAAEQVAERIREAAPRRTGALAASVRVEREGDRVTIKAGGTADTTKAGRAGSQDAIFDEAVAMEYGNSRTRAEPFFYGPAEDGRSTFDGAANTALDNPKG